MVDTESALSRKSPMLVVEVVNDSDTLVTTYSPVLVPLGPVDTKVVGHCVHKEQAPRSVVNVVNSPAVSEITTTFPVNSRVAPSPSVAVKVVGNSVHCGHTGVRFVVIVVNLPELSVVTRSSTAPMKKNP